MIYRGGLIIDNKLNINKINSFFLALFLFLDSVTNPIVRITDSSISIWVVTLTMLITSLYINKKNFNKKMLALALIITIIFLINFLIVDFKEETLLIFVEFVKYGLVALYFSSLVEDYEMLLKSWYFFGCITLLLWIFLLDDVNERNVSYMVFGRQITLSFIIFALYYYDKGRHKLNLLLMVITFVLIGVFANRSSLLIALSVILFFEMSNLFKMRIYSAYLKTSLFLISVFFVIYNFKNILLYIISTFDNLGINSYIFKKTMKTVEVGLEESSSGRDTLTNKSVEIIKESHFMPNGIGYFQEVTGEIYPHNIFLDVLISFGFFGVFILIFLFSWLIYKFLKSKDKTFKKIVLTLFFYSVIRLYFSGTFWYEPVFFSLVGLMLSSKSISSTHHKTLNQFKGQAKKDVKTSLYT